MKKIVSLILIVCLAAACIGCGAKAEPAEAKPAEQAAQSAPVQEAAPAQGNEPKQLTTIGITEDPSAGQTQTQPTEHAAPASNQTMVVETRGYKVEFLRAEKGKDYAGTDVAVVYYRFTNSNADGAGFWTVCADSARQNGVLLDAESLVMDYADVVATTTLVSNGQSIDVKCMYPVQNYTDPINLSIAIYDASGYNIETTGGCTITLG